LAPPNFFIAFLDLFRDLLGLPVGRREELVEEACTSSSSEMTEFVGPGSDMTERTCRAITKRKAVSGCSFMFKLDGGSRSIYVFEGLTTHVNFKNFAININKVSKQYAFQSNTPFSPPYLYGLV
jgi:hypothetical protein